ncbi:MAG TPA: chaplin family protein [Marmoricola sp.]|nr:chaplin family protein [Marmoricola sp.]
MHAYVRRALCAVGLTGGAVLLGIGLADAASADGGSTGPVTSGESGILSGNQTAAGAQAPINLSGNQVTVIGQRNHNTSTSASSASSSGSGSPTTTGQNGGGSGNQTAVHVQAPVNASGNQVTVIGQDNTNHAAGASTSSGPSATAGGSGHPTTSGASGIGSGNQSGVDVQAPINASCNQVTVIGQDNPNQCAAGTSTAGAQPGSSGSPTTTGQGGILSGNQTGIGVQLPINLTGNQVTVIGQGNDLSSLGGSSSGGTTSGSGSSTGGPTTSGASGIGSGNQTAIGVQAPINASGNQVTAIGQDNTNGSLSGSSTPGPGSGTSTGAPTTSGQSGIGSGNQTAIGVQAPINASGNQVTVIGQDNTNTSTGGASTGGTSTGSPTTSGQSGIGSGNQTGVDVGAPIAPTGNQITVIGQDNTNTSTGGASTGGTSSTGETTTGAGGIGSGNQTPIGAQVPVDTSGNQVTVIGQDNNNSSSSGSTSGGTPGGTIPGGGVVSPPTGGSTPPTGGVVSPPTGGTATNVSQGVSAPSATGLPNTGLPGDLFWLALLGLMLLGLGSVLTLRRTALVRAS